MPSTISLVKRLKLDYPAIQFKEGEVFSWSPSTNTILYRTTGSAQDLIHELAHAVLSHTDYRRDIELVAIERDAWEKALTDLGPTYGIDLSRDVIEESMDSYRDWLHARSTCPNCQATGLESDKHLYFCPACRSNWTVNEARTCGLRRLKT